MPTLNLKPTHKAITAYYAALERYQQLGVSHETAVRAAFQALLEACARQRHWTLVCEYTLRVPERSRGTGPRATVPPDSRGTGPRATVLPGTRGTGPRATVLPGTRGTGPRATVLPGTIRLDGALLDAYNLPRGTWEAKGVHGNLRAEIEKKFDAGYPQDNILFQTPERAILYQNGREVLDADITAPETLVTVLETFFAYERENAAEWHAAVAEFKTKVPALKREVEALIRTQHETNARFRTAFADFHQLCQAAIHPELSQSAVEEMLIQHLLTERTFRTVFANPDFTRRNIIAREIENVIDALTSKAFSRDAFLQNLDRFYRAIEREAATLVDFSQKQHFLNTVYEQFFQGASADVADTHGIVYTPQPIVDFMVKSVAHLLKTEFNRSLSDEGVHIIDAFVGTGNFIVRLMRELEPLKLTAKYRSELWCNEVLLLPYYIASLNIEHEFYEATGEYLPFEGISLVDTFDLAEDRQLSLLTQENTARVEKQKAAPMFVIIGNPPYNVGQANEHDQNQNRKYAALDKLIQETYAKDSGATNKKSLYDLYVKSIKWASERIGEEGIVALVTNNSFLDAKAFDGMRKHLAQDFDRLYVLDLGGNARKDTLVSDASVFGIQVGVSINFFVKEAVLDTVSRGHETEAASHTVARGPVPRDRSHTEAASHTVARGPSDATRASERVSPAIVTHTEAASHTVARGPVPRDHDMAREPLSTVARGPVPREFSVDRSTARDRPSPYGNGDNPSTARDRPSPYGEGDNSAHIFYFRTDDTWNKNQKFDFLAQTEHIGNVPWQTLQPDARHTWLTEGLNTEFLTFIPIGSKTARRAKGDVEGVIFKLYSNGVKTNRDPWTCNFNRNTLAENMQVTHDFYNSQLREWNGTEDKSELTVDNFVTYADTKIKWTRDLRTKLNRGRIAEYDASKIRHSLYRPFTKTYLYFDRHFNDVVYRFPSIFPTPETESENRVICLSAAASNKPFHTLMVSRLPDVHLTGDSQCFPFYAYDEDGTNRRENITDWALRNFRAHYGDETITKWDIFNYIYGFLHHPAYRERYAADLKRDLPHIPFVKDFWAFANAGAQLAELHVNYEAQPQYELTSISTERALNLRVERMKLSKDRASLIYNESLTLEGIPPAVFEYRLGKRSALEWVLDQYRVKTDDRSQITNDPNDAESPQRIVELIGSVITVSLKTVEIVAGLPPFP